jgi:hypothetical protein
MQPCLPKGRRHKYYLFLYLFLSTRAKYMCLSRRATRALVLGNAALPAPINSSSIRLAFATYIF